MNEKLVCPLITVFLSLLKDIFVTSLYDSCKINLILTMKNFVNIAEFMVLEICTFLVNFSAESKVNAAIFRINDLGRILQ